VEQKRVVGVVLTILGFFITVAAALGYSLVNMHPIVFIIGFALGIFLFGFGLYILVKTKPEPEKGEEYDEEIPDESVDFDDWAKKASVETFKSERPDPSQYKPKKEYKAFPSLKKDEKKSEAPKDDK
jgi:hypothetical protein